MATLAQRIAEIQRVEEAVRGATIPAWYRNERRARWQRVALVVSATITVLMVTALLAAWTPPKRYSDHVYQRGSGETQQVRTRRLKVDACMVECAERGE